MVTIQKNLDKPNKPNIPKRTQKLPPIIGGSFNDRQEPYEGNLTVLFEDLSRETYKNASILRLVKDNKGIVNTLWVLFYNKVICLKNIYYYKITS